MKNVNAYTGPQRFAHRGLVQAAPENTLGAFQGAVDGGYEGIEIDVQMTRDGEIVIAHDSNFTRMTLGHPDGGSNRRISIEPQLVLPSPSGRRSKPPSGG